MIETLILWLPIPVLVGVFLVGFALAWWRRAEDARQMRATLRQRDEAREALSEDYLNHAKLLDAARAENAYLKRGWQAVRAAVEQHTVTP